jgi:predicted Zn-dependent protease with MMP-like domain/Flp pilus assembly protein TadD
MEDLERILEKAWKKLESGDLSAARTLADKAVEADAKAPETQLLCGQVLFAESDYEGAADAFRRASTADPDWFDPAYLLADALHSLGEHEQAQKAIDRALDIAEEEEEYLDALLLKTEIALALGDDDDAAAALAELPPTDLPGADWHIRAGGCFIELEDFEKAAHHFDAACRLDPKSADAWHGRGIVAEADGEEPRRLECFLKVRELDLRAPHPPWHMSEARIEKLVEAALAELPPRARKLLENVPIVVEDYPSEALVRDGLDPRLLGLFTGPSHAEPSNVMGQSPLLQQIFLYQRNIERDAPTEEDAEAEIHITLLHETGHYFGMSESELEDAGLD